MPQFFLNMSHGIMHTIGEGDGPTCSDDDTALIEFRTEPSASTVIP